jgi:hypothetical protein
MDLQLIYGGYATLEDMYALYELGFEFVVEDGRVSEVLRQERKEKKKCMK